MTEDKETLQTEFHGLLTSLELCAQKKDLARIRMLVGRLYAWQRKTFERIASDPAEAHTEAEDLRQKLRASKNSFDATVASYKALLHSFDRFRRTIDAVHQLKRFEELPQVLDTIKEQDTLHTLHLILDQDLFAGHAPEEIGLAPSEQLRRQLFQFTPTPHAPRLFLGDVRRIEKAAFFLGLDEDPAEGSCFIFSLGHKYLHGKIIGTVAAYDPDPMRFIPDMATDFLSHFCDILASTLINALEHAQLEELTVRDALTGVNNRAYLERHAPRILEFSERKKFPVHLLFIDLNGFKAVNDTLGHEAGDLILINVAQAIQTMVRKYDIFVRMGGDEFVVILPDTDEGMASTFRARLHATLGRLDVAKVCGQDTSLAVSVSVGMARHQAGQSLDELIREADRLMYANKSSRNTLSK